VSACADIEKGGPVKTGSPTVHHFMIAELRKGSSHPKSSWLDALKADPKQAILCSNSSLEIISPAKISGN
jgi:hypothetical protein